jgi:hypothetical protein
VRGRDFIAAAFFGCLVGLVTFALAPQNVVLVLVLGLLASGLTLLVTWPPIGSFLPTIFVRTQIAPPQRRSKGKLRRDTFDLVKDIRDHLRAEPLPMVASYEEHRATAAAMERTTDEAAKRAIWDAYTGRSVEHWERERQDMTARFGGRLLHVLRQYVDRGMLSAGDAGRVEWECQSLHWSAEAAARLEALARRL